MPCETGWSASGNVPSHSPPFLGQFYREDTDEIGVSFREWCFWGLPKSRRTRPGGRAFLLFSFPAWSPAWQLDCDRHVRASWAQGQRARVRSRGQTKGAAWLLSDSTEWSQCSEAANIRSDSVECGANSELIPVLQYSASILTWGTPRVSIFLCCRDIRSCLFQQHCQYSSPSAAVYTTPIESFLKDCRWFYVIF